MAAELGFPKSHPKHKPGVVTLSLSQSCAGRGARQDPLAGAELQAALSMASMMGTQGAAPPLTSHLAPQGAGDEGHLTWVFLVSSVSFFLSFFFPAASTCAEVWMPLLISPG